jgi:gas vesicle protein
MSSNNQDNSLSNFLLGMVIGLLTGGILSLIYSPNSGEENRRKARAWADDTQSTIKDRACQVRDKAENLRDEMENPYGKARQFIDEKRYTLEQRWNNWQAKREADKLSEAKDREAAQEWDDSEAGVDAPVEAAVSEADAPKDN